MRNVWEWNESRLRALLREISEKPDKEKDRSENREAVFEKK